MAGLTVADASALIAILDEANAHHAAAIDAFSEVEQFHVHPVTLAEVLVHPVRNGQATTVQAQLTALGMLVTSPSFEPVALAELRVHTGLKMPDCLVLATARSIGGIVLSFDDRLTSASC